MLEALWRHCFGARNPCFHGNFESDYCLVSVGRKPYTEGLGLENVNVETEKSGKIVIDKHFKM